MSSSARKTARERDRLAPADPLAVTPGPPVADADLPRVAIVVPNLNGERHLSGCFQSLDQLDYPEDRVEAILVDNGSSDDSIQAMRTHHAWVKVVANKKNLGFAGGCNQGARAASRPEALVFLNNDMRVEKGWLRELVAPIVRGECQATTAKMLSWDGKKVDSAGGGMNFHGFGIQRGYLDEPGPEHEVARKTLFACGAAMAIDAAVFREVGGFDEEYFAYYEDVDLGWRMWVQGYACHYVPGAVCYHHHSSTSGRMPKEMIRLLQVRNPLLSCVKNYDDENLRTLLGPLLALAVRRMWIVSGLEDGKSFRIEEASSGQRGGPKGFADRVRRKIEDRVPVRRSAAADLIGINDLLGRWDHWMARRADVQRRRKRPDAEIFELFLKPHWCLEPDEGYEELQAGLTKFLGLDERFGPDSIPEPKG